MTGHLGEADRPRMARRGRGRCRRGQGLALLDAGAGRDEALLVPAGWTWPGCAPGRAPGRSCRRCWRGLVARPRRRRRGPTARPRGLAGRLAAAGRAAGGEQEQVLLDLVRAQAAAVLGHASAGGGASRARLPGSGL